MIAIPLTAAQMRAGRRALQLTQGELAPLLGVHVMTVSRWELGKMQPTAHQRVLLALYVEDPALLRRVATLTASVMFRPRTNAQSNAGGPGG